MDKVQLCIDNIPSWSKLKKENVNCEVITGGLTNVLTRIYVNDEDIEHHQVLFREFGKGSELFVDRKQENAMFKILSLAGVGPKHVYSNIDFRIEEFIEAKALAYHELGDINHLKEIANLISKFHTLSFENNKDVIAKTPILESNLRKWWAEASKVSFNDTRNCLKLASLDLGKLYHEIDWLMERVDAINCPIVFSHNDLQEGNILKSESGLVLIDFEYSSFNFRGFDFGNFFCEMAINNCLSNYPGYCYNADGYPTVAVQHEFFKSYLDAQDVPKEQQTKELLDALVNEAAIFALAAHLMWSFWSIIQSEHSTIDFGYLQYATVRLDAYFAMKSILGHHGYAAEKPKPQVLHKHTHV